MTGESVFAAWVHQGDVIHLTPHTVNGVKVGHRELDVEVAAEPLLVRPGVVVIDWRGCVSMLGASPTMTGATAYENGTKVLRIGRAGA